MGIILNYKKWSIEKEIAYLEKQIKRFPDSPESKRRQDRVDDLKKDLND